MESNKYFADFNIIREEFGQEDREIDIELFCLLNDGEANELIDLVQSKINKAKLRSIRRDRQINLTTSSEYHY